MSFDHFRRGEPPANLRGATGTVGFDFYRRSEPFGQIQGPAGAILVKLSVKTGSAGNTTTGTASGSLGKYISTTELVSNTPHALFDAVAAPENVNKESEYRCVFVHNSFSGDAYINAKVYVLSQVPDGANLQIGVDPTAASLIGSGTAQALEVADENTAPSGITFSDAGSPANAISLGTIEAGYCRAIWLKRVATSSGAVSNDGATLRITGLMP